MANKIFEGLFKQHVDAFKSNFSETSKSLFYDADTQKLIHAGEFGAYRENICREFLKFIIPARFDIDNGFLINSNQGVSTQCDLVIYDHGSTPVIRSRELQKFFPIESVLGVGEVKSTLTLSQLKDALLKLSKTKELCEMIPIDGIISITNQRNLLFDPKTNVNDQIFTFLICQKFNFKFNDLVDQFQYIYSGVERRLWHNLILSVDDGLVLYCDNSEEDGVPCPYPVFKGSDLKSYMIVAEDHEYQKIFMLFSQIITNLTSSTNLQIINMYKYLGAENMMFNTIKED